MCKPGFGCERPECASSTGICGSTTFGTGELDPYGYWRFPCEECEKAWEEHEEKLRSENTLEITGTIRSTLYDVLCHNCDWTTTAIRPVNSEFICVKCGVHENMGEVVYTYMKREDIL